MSVLRLFESIHGHLGVLAMAALLHPAILLRKGRPLSFGLKWAVGLSTAFAALAFGTGIAIYGSYRELVKRDLLLESLETGMLFETKEHIAWGVLTMALGACATALTAPRSAKRLRQAAAIVYGVAFVLALLTVALGTYVASVRGFP